MFNKLEVFRFVLIFAILFIGTNISFGQGLGSSSGLFGSSNKSSKPNNSAEKPKPKPKSSEPAKSTSKPAKAKPQNASNQTNRANNRENSNTNRTPRRQTANSTTPRRNQNTVVVQNNPVQTTTVITPGNQNPTVETYNESLESSLEEGNAARDARDYLRAENAYRRAAQLSPNDARGVYGLGNIFSDQQRWDEAEKYYRMAIKAEPDYADSYIALSYVLSQPIAAENLSERYMEAEKMARTAIQLDSQNPFAYDQLGVALELRGIITQETENAYRRAIQLSPRFALAYAHLGRLLRRRGMLNESAEAYRQAIQFSNDAPTMIQVAEVMQSQQRYTESEQLLRRALTTDAKNPTALFLLGRALITKGSKESFAEAEIVLKKGLEVSPNNFVAYTLQASLYTRQDNFAEAEKSLFKALQIATVNEKKRLAQEFENVADGLMRIGNKSDAVRLYKQAVSLDAKRNSAVEKLAKAQMS